LPQFLRHCEPAPTANDNQKMTCTRPFERGPPGTQGWFPFALLKAGELPHFSAVLAKGSSGGENASKTEDNLKAW